MEILKPLQQLQGGMGSLDVIVKKERLLTKQAHDARLLNQRLHRLYLLDIKELVRVDGNSSEM